MSSSKKKKLSLSNVHEFHNEEIIDIQIFNMYSFISKTIHKLYPDMPYTQKWVLVDEELYSEGDEDFEFYSYFNDVEIDFLYW